MSTKRLILLVLVVGAVGGLYYAGGPKTGNAAAPRPDARARLTAAPGRLVHGLGVGGASIIAPAVRKMVYSTERELALLRQDLKTARTNLVAVNSAREGAKRVAAMDSSALAQLAAGRPIQAFRDAMQANGLATAVRDNLRAE
ncbi:MAG: hypothetical protein FIB01_12715 [Gemmatimonadetes bacterium]|nr:hypothetical protein [Gemmatimonadota bacterium]